MSEIAFVVPSAEMYNRYLADPHGGLYFIMVICQETNGGSYVKVSVIRIYKTMDKT